MRKQKRKQKEIEGTSTESTLNVAVEAAGGTGEEYSELSNDMSEEKKDSEEAGETTAAKGTEEI